MKIGRAVAKRDIDRVRQHKRHGWYRRDRQPLIPFRPGTVLVECPCGYLGWIDRRVAPATETEVKAARDAAAAVGAAPRPFNENKSATAQFHIIGERPRRAGRGG